MMEITEIFGLKVHVLDEPMQDFVLLYNDEQVFGWRPGLKSFVQLAGKPIAPEPPT